MVKRPWFRPSFHCDHTQLRRKMPSTTIGVLAIQGAFLEHITLLRNAASTPILQNEKFEFVEVRTSLELARCDALIIPGGESTTISLVAARTDLLESLRDFVKVERKPTWGTCAGLILLSEAANSTKKGGQELIGGLDVRVNRNHFGRQIESFEADIELPFLDQAQGLQSPYPGIFIRAPVVERILAPMSGTQIDEASIPESVVAPSKQVRAEKSHVTTQKGVEVMAILPGRTQRGASSIKLDNSEVAGDIVAVRQDNVFGTSFHPELTRDSRIHVWWLQQVLRALEV